MSDSENFSNDEIFFEQESEDEDVEKMEGMMKSLKPYLFEPEIDISSSESAASDEEEFLDLTNDEVSAEEKTRTGNTEWCTCGKCKVEQRDIDCLCCQEVGALQDKIEQQLCVTQLDQFKTLCLNADVLKNVLVGLHESKGDHLEENIKNRSMRYAAYKQFTWWLYQHLGKGNRRVIPSCALWEIRNLYPELDNNYVPYSEGKKD
ncbi:P2X purinoceptor 7-like [Hydractinia symbiolongicarpus]|uniref:P2X purinoceptor 7-like n=1 Tax=Hydractinia symbiolongicarpus TaxID=13093 RepID=UPI00254DBE01|nr:P2X purinoceptor 7-like [Hydractinia symbiolongicarpus]